MNQPPRPGRPSAPPAARLPRLALATLALALLAALCLQTAPAQDATGAIRGLALLSDQPGQLQVFWIPPETLPLDYRLDWSRSDQPYPDQATDQNRAFPPGSSTSMRLSDLEPGVEYKLRIRARYDGWLGPWSDDARVLVAGPNAPALAVQSTAAGGLQLDWTADPPASARPLSGFDLRYIESAHNDQPDPRWTLRNSVAAAGHRRYLLDGLEDGAAYDVQLRWRGADGPGDWSPSARGTTLDHGDHADRASELPIGVARAGRIGALGDQDVFRIDLGAAATLTLSLSADAPLQATLDDATGRRLAHGTSAPSDDDASLSLTSPVQAGPHFLTISHAALGLAAYSVSAQLLAVRTSRSEIVLSDTIPLQLDSSAQALMPSSDTGESAEVLFSFTLSEDTEVWIHSTGSGEPNIGYNLIGELLTDSGTLIASNDDSTHWSLRSNFMLRSALDAGTYVVRVTQQYPPYDISFRVHLRTATTPGLTVASASELQLNVPQTGRVSATASQNVYALELESGQRVILHATSFSTGTPLDVSITSGTEETEFYTFPHGPSNPALDRSAFLVTVWLDAGTHYIRVTPQDAAADVPYVIEAIPEDDYDRDYQYCEQLTRTQLGSEPGVLSDPLFGCQWYLKNTAQFDGDTPGFDINVEPAWASTRGAGVTVALVYNTFQADHEDLAANVNLDLSYNVGSPLWRLGDPLRDFGTRLAGIMVADDNDRGVVGIAPDATLVFHGGIALRDHDNSEAAVAEAMRRNKDVVAVSNNAWGWGELGLDNLTPASAEWETAVIEGVTQGYGEKGVLYVFASGDHDDWADNTNLSERRNFYAVTTVCGIAYDDQRALMSTRGANLWICAPSGEGRTPRVVSTELGDRYAVQLSSSSFDRNVHVFLDPYHSVRYASAIVSGVAALIRSANPDLTWRDVKLILAESARRNDSTSSTWLSGATRYRGDGAYDFSHDYGFGAVDAGAAVALARDWTNLPDLLTTEATSRDSRQAIADGTEVDVPGAQVTSTLTIDSTVHFTEYVEIHIELDHSSFRDLQIELVSPTGTVSTILPAVRSTRFNGQFYQHELRASARFGSARHLGENPSGVWTLRLADHYHDHQGDLVSWRLKIYGHGELPERPTLTSATPGMRQLTLGWTAPANSESIEIDHYELRYIRSDATEQGAERPAEDWTVVENAGGSDSLSYLLSGLAPGGRYDLQLRAVNEVGAGPWSDVYQAQASLELPWSPTSVLLTPIHLGLRVAWNPPAEDGGAPITSYELRHIRNDAPDRSDSFWSTQTISNGIEPLSAQIQPLLQGIAYDVQIRARTSVADSPWTPVETARPVFNTLVRQASSVGGAAGAGGGGGGGGGAPPVAAPSEADFDWNVTRDIESLAREHDEPTGMWSDGETLRLLHNAASGADRLFAYDLATGERVEQMEFELDRRNRFAHGIWSDGETAWVSDSGQDRLFAYILASGERVEELEFDLAERNRDPRGIWSDGQTLVVLDAVKDALFGYDPASGELAFEHALDPLNRSPRGIWSDGLGIWISDDGANRIFAYRLEEDGLRRVEAEEFGFRVLLKAGAGEARGIWSDGDTLWLADAEDAEVYSFNLPDAIQAQLASLSLSDLELDFSPRRLSYSLELPPDLDETTVDATAAQEVAAVSIEPDDADPDNGHQVALDGLEALTVTVTSQDGSRSREYRVTFERAACLDGQSEAVDELLRTVEFAGGGLDALEACAREHGISALYHFDGDSWRGLFLDAPDFLSRPFREFFAGGLPQSTELISVRLSTSGE